MIYSDLLTYFKFLGAWQAAKTKQNIYTHTWKPYGIIQLGNSGYLIAESVSRYFLNQAPITDKYGSNIVSVREGIKLDKLK